MFWGNERYHQVFDVLPLWSRFVLQSFSSYRSCKVSERFWMNAVLTSIDTPKIFGGEEKKIEKIFLKE